MILSGVDIGLNGGITIINTQRKIVNIYPMPVRKIIDKEAVTVFSKDDKGNKITIKSGPNKDSYKRVIKTPEKSHNELAIHSINTVFNGVDILQIEQPEITAGNSSRSSSTVARNYGKLLAIAELNNINIHTIAAHKWKKDLNLSKDKSEAIKLAEELLSEYKDNGWIVNIFDKHNDATRIIKFKTSEDGLAESFLIGYNYLKENNANQAE